MMHRQRAWLVCFCVILFAAACVAEPAHFHPTSGASGQHCSLCIASHSVARPTPLVSAVAMPRLCIGVLALPGTDLLDFQAVRSLYIRPPPSL